MTRTGSVVATLIAVTLTVGATLAVMLSGIVGTLLARLP